MARRGIDLEDADSNKALGNQFLMEMLELREDIDAANEECDVGKLDRLRVGFQRVRARLPFLILTLCVLGACDRANDC